MLYICVFFCLISDKSQKYIIQVFKLRKENEGYFMGSKLQLCIFISTFSFFLTKNTFSEILSLFLFVISSSFKIIRRRNQFLFQKAFCILHYKIRESNLNLKFGFKKSFSFTVTEQFVFFKFYFNEEKDRGGKITIMTLKGFERAMHEKVQSTVLVK